MAALPTLATIAQLLSGEVCGDQVMCPGPGHSDKDRSLSVKLDPSAPRGLVVHSFAGDDDIAAKDDVCRRLGLPPFEPTKKNGQGGGAWKLIREHVYYTADGNPLVRKRKMLDGDGKRQFPQQHWDGYRWVNGVAKDWPRVLYRLPELLKSPVTSTVYIAEGEGDCDALAALHLMATTAGGVSAVATWTPETIEHLRDRPVVIFADSDEPGRKYAEAVAGLLHPVAKSVKFVDLYPGRSDGADVSNFLEKDRAGIKLLEAVKAAPLWESKQDNGKHEDAGSADELLIAELAALPKLQYERRREEAAKQLGIRRLSVLDKLVEGARAVEHETSSDPGELLYEHWATEAAAEVVDGAILLRSLKEVIQNYVFMGDEQATAVALWIVFSWLHEHEGAITHSPILYVTSAEKDSGKSTLLGVVNFLARRSLQSVDISGPALFRSIAKWTPTLIVDEADDALADNVDLRSAINSGWTRGQGVIRCHADTREPELFSTFAPKVVAMKGRNLPDTTLSRSIVITMKPRRPDDPKERTADFTHTDNELFRRLRSQLIRWTADSAEELGRATPEIPPEFHNRRRANWVPLLAVAEACGWKAAGLQAAQAIEAITSTFDPSTGVQLLQAIKDAFELRGADRMTSGSLVGDLIADETGPWAAWNRGKPISQRQVASLLKPCIRPGSIKLDPGSGSDKTAKGYLFAWLKDAFSRFCTLSTAAPPFSSGTAGTDLFSQEYSAISDRHREDPVPDGAGEKCSDNNMVPECRIENEGADEREESDGSDPVAASNESCNAGIAQYEANPFRVLGPAPAGTRCILCGSGAPVRIKHGGGIDLWHPDCARRYLAAMVEPPVKVPPDTGSEEHVCRHCNGPLDGTEQLCAVDGEMIWLHPACQGHYLDRSGE